MSPPHLMLLGAAFAIGGCAVAAPSRELVDARAAYREAANGPAQKLVPDKLLAAQQELEFAASPKHDPELARTLAYIAHRHVLAAVASAGLVAAQNEKTTADRDYKELLELSVKRSREKLGLTQKILATTQAELEAQERELREKRSKLKQKEGELEKEKLARADAEARLQGVIKSLEQVASVKEDARGTIITLSAAVLFKAKDSVLLPYAETKLRKLAEVLDTYDKGRSIVVAAHTDSIGAASVNRKLSLERAESIRSFLVQLGIAAERIQAVGNGEDEPIADNKSPDGRVINNRVEVIVETADD